MDYGELFEVMQTLRDEVAKLRKFTEAVQNMRSLQKEYFKNRDHLILQRCKAAEKAVDEYFKIEGEKGASETVQQSLFQTSIMSKLSGKIVEYTAKDGTIQKGIVRDIDQCKDFEAYNKVLVRPCDDDFNALRVRDKWGDEIITLKGAAALTTIGYTD